MTIAGIPAAIEQVRQLVTPKSQKLVDIPTAGAWHCALLDPVVSDFRNYLDGLIFAAPSVAVMDNVTGASLPSDPGRLRDHLALHLSRPVMWEACIRNLVEMGARSCLEVGYGDMLTRFGFFVNRDISHKAIEPVARVSPGRRPT
jgi:[acyl-carrier-protein] S-malonyltransferase